MLWCLYHASSWSDTTQAEISGVKKNRWNHSNPFMVREDSWGFFYQYCTWLLRWIPGILAIELTYPSLLMTFVVRPGKVNTREADYWLMQIWPPYHHCLCQQKGLGRLATGRPGASRVLWEASLMSESLAMGSQRRQSWPDLGWAVHELCVLEIVHVEEKCVGSEKPTFRITLKRGGSVPVESPS